MINLEGVIGSHYNNGKIHEAIILKVNKNKNLAKALFFTSSNNWNYKARKATKEKIALASFIFSKTTYLAPVIRPLYEFELHDIYFPKHRVRALYNEFFVE